VRKELPSLPFLRTWKQGRRRSKGEHVSQVEGKGSRPPFVITYRVCSFGLGSRWGEFKGGNAWTNLSFVRKVLESRVPRLRRLYRGLRILQLLTAVKWSGGKTDGGKGKIRKNKKSPCLKSDRPSPNAMLNLSDNVSL